MLHYFFMLNCFSTGSYKKILYLCRVLKNKVMKAVIYARVSTSAQDYERQLEELRDYATRMGYEVVKEFSEKISGAKKVEERAALSDLLDYVGSHEVSKVLIYECSRLSRRVVDFLSVIEQLTEQGVSVYIHQNGLETLQPDGKPNPIAQLVLGILAQFNSMERGLIRSRMESGYNHYRANGGKVGRKEGYRKSDQEMKEQYAEQLRLLRKGYSLANVSKLTGTAINTLRKLRKIA
jgi:DNA invertase Pin-like site-specific DNA recombinase